mmetsp:Transcript_45105/g.84643  ORF Transcript_45105/g.84643 Transcript_45105/m.84643 type:complete len:319 (-) Transcript_45105:763-1719(-)
MVDDTLPLCNQIEVVCELLGILDQRVTWSREGLVLDAVGPHFLLARLHAHPDSWHQDIAFCQQDVRLAHHKPLAGAPVLLEVSALGEFPAAPHSHHGLLILTLGQLFQVVVSLKEHLADTCACKPIGRVDLCLHTALCQATFRHYWVQRKDWLPPLSQAHLQGERQVLQVHGLRRLERGRHSHGVRGLVEDHAAHAAGGVASQALSCGCAVGYLTSTPTNLVLLTGGFLQLGVFFLRSCLLIFDLLQQHLCHTLTMDRDRLLVVSKVAQAAHRQTAVTAEKDLFAVGVFRGVELLGRQLPDLLHCSLDWCDALAQSFS